MSGAGGVSIARTRGENRFYYPLAMRKHLQQQQQKKAQKPLVSRNCSAESEKKWTVDDECESSMSTTESNCSVPGRGRSDSTNLDRFLEYTTPVVPAQYLPKTSMRGWRAREAEFHPYFVLGDLWESFGEWSAYGAGVPLLLNGIDSVMQYYVPYLSGIQLYIDPSKPTPRLRGAGEESDTELFREMSIDGSSDSGGEREANNVVEGAWSQQNIRDANIWSFNRLLLRNKPFVGSSSDEGEICNPSDRLVFEYLEQDPPYSREPLADKISIFASQFPLLGTYRSCDLSRWSWISVAWYPIYRIPTGPTLQNLDACFLTFHSLSTPLHNTSTDGLHLHGSGVREARNGDMPFKLSLPVFGLAFYKFKVSVWDSSGVYECQRANSLLQVADNWLRCLHVNHPDYRFFVSHNAY